MTFPTTGRPGNLLSMLVPGTFVIFNAALGLYWVLPGFRVFLTSEFVRGLTSSNALVALLVLLASCFAYLIGVILRLFKTERPDAWSAAYIRFRHHRSEKEKPLFVTESFPYVGWLGWVCRHDYPPEALAFYDRFWCPPEDRRRQKQFFNLCKTALFAIDSKASTEVYAAETISRYISGMFYGLMLSIILVVLVLGYYLAVLRQVPIDVIAVAVVYSGAFVLVLRHYRFLRIKEVETVFAATFAHSNEWPFSQRKKDMDSEKQN